MGQIAAYLFLGVCAGVLSGLIGIGGGILIVPALVFIFGMSQHQAQGTSLAVLLPPVGLLAATMYYQQGYIDLKVAALICLGFVLGSVFGVKIAFNIPDLMLKKIFGAILLLVGLKMLLNK